MGLLWKMKNDMNKHTLQNNIIYIVLAVLLSMPAVASAQVPLEVMFTPDPLFSEGNFLPVDDSVGTAKVTNNSGMTQTILAATANMSDPDGFGDLLNMLIGDSSETFFDDTLSAFFAAGEVDLGELLNGDSETFTFTVSFINTSDNSFQGKSLGFDVCVGFEGGDSSCGDIEEAGAGDGDGDGDVVQSLGGGGGGFGGGGIIDSTPLTISGEQVEELDIDVQTALIVWDTNLYSTSQVVYGLASGGPYSISLLSPNFGYPLATTETFVKVLHHEVLLTGLIPGETYNYRVVSRASPPTISFEHTFEFEEPTPLLLPEVEPEGGGSGSQGSVGGGGSGSQGPIAGLVNSISSLGSTLAQALGGEGSTNVRTSDDLLREFEEARSEREPSSSEPRSRERIVRDAGSDPSISSEIIAAAILGLEGDLLGIFRSSECVFMAVLIVVLIFVVWGLLVIKNRRRYTLETRLSYRRIYFPLAFATVLLVAYVFNYICIVLPLSTVLIFSLLWAFWDGLKDTE